MEGPLRISSIRKYSSSSGGGSSSSSSSSSSSGSSSVVVLVLVHGRTGCGLQVVVSLQVMVCGLSG